MLLALKHVFSSLSDAVSPEKRIKIIVHLHRETAITVGLSKATPKNLLDFTIIGENLKYCKLPHTKPPLRVMQFSQSLGASYMRVFVSIVQY